MPAKEPFHAQKKSQKNAEKNKHEILLTSKSVDETKEKLKRASLAEKAMKVEKAKEFVVENSLGIQSLRVNLDEQKAASLSTKGLLRASRSAEGRLFVNGIEDKSVENSVENSGDNQSNIPVSVPLANAARKVPRYKKYVAGAMSFLGGLLTVSWLGVVVGYVSEYIGWDEILNLQPHIMGGFLAGVLAPVAFIWFIVHLFQRGSEVSRYASALRGEMENMLIPSNETRSVLQKDMQELTKQASDLSRFSETMLYSIHNARTGLKDDLSLMEAMSVKSEKHLKMLTKLLNERSSQLLALTDEIEARANRIEKQGNKGSKAWDGAAEKILQKADAIEALMQQGSEKISKATDKAADKTNKVHQIISGTFADIDSKADKMQSRLVGLSDAMRDNQKEMTMMTDLVSADTTRLSDLLEGQMIGLHDLEGLSQKSMGIMQQVMEKDATQHETLSEALQDRLIELSTISEMAQEKIGAVEEALQKQSAIVIKEFDAAQTALIDRVNSASEGLRDHETSIVEGLNSVAMKVSDEIDAAASMISSKQESLSEIVSQHAGKLGGVVEKATNQTANIEKVLFDRFDKTQEALLEGVDKVSKAMASKHDTVALELGARAESLTKIIDNAKIDVERAEDKLFDRFDKTKRTIMENVDEMAREITAKQDNIILKFGSHSDSVVKAVQAAQTQIERSEDTLFERLDKVSEQITQGVERASLVLEAKQDDIATNITQRSEALTTTVEAAKDDIRRAEEALYKRHENIHTDFKNTYERLSASVQDAKHMVQDMDQGLAKEQGRLNSTVEKFKADQALLETLLKGHDETLEAIETSASKTLELTREMLLEDTKTQEEFMKNLQNKVVSLKDVSVSIDHQTSESNAAISRLGSAQDLLLKQSEVLTRVTKQAEDDLEQFEGALYAKQQQTKKQAEIIIADLSSIDKSLEGRLPQLLEKSYDVKEGLSAVSQELERSSSLLDQKLKAQAAKIEHLSRHSVDQMTDSVGSLAETLVQIGSMVDGVQDSLEKSTRNFTDKAGQLASVSREATIAADQAANVFVKRTETMRRAANETSDNVQKLEKTQKNRSQDAFMGSAKFVIESLNSLAVDITRAIDGGIHERMWKAYKGGDLGIFTTYLVSIEDELPIDEYQRKFIKESEFRSYILSFIGQYEEMMTQATKIDHGGLLLTTFGTSDVGKLYRMLCNIADTEPLTQLQQIA